MKLIISTVAGCLATGLTFAAIDASAATIRVKCEQRGTQRADISIDGSNLALLPVGQMYGAQAVSGGNSATSPGEPLVGDQVEFDFSSDRGNIAAGAVPIAPDFIVGGSVTGKILAPNGSTVISDTVACLVRSR